ncbi:MAG TPA: glycerate kinase [Polyangiaceae bacterium]|nr:glycerate kinase [Polyangiaceae bacterium]
MRLLVAPDSFKGSLSASDAAAAIARGASRALPGASVSTCALADGGEGVGAVLAGTEAMIARRALVTGPLGAPVGATWWLSADGRAAIIESAQAIGLGLVPETERAPLRSTTRGVGELLLAALDAGATRIEVGLGGTATTDGGAGMAQALGVELVGASARVTAEELPRIRAARVDSRDRRVERVEILALTDVDSPLTGPLGAARVFGPQKGASATDCERLDAALSRLEQVVGVPGVEPGDGAAGGLGWGLRVFAGARLVSGVERVLDAVGFDAKLDGVDLVITGEGRLDAQSARGKVVSGVLRRAARRGVPVVALVGAVDASARELLDRGLAGWASLVSDRVTSVEAMTNAAALLERLADDYLRRWSGGGASP